MDLESTFLWAEMSVEVRLSTFGSPLDHTKVGPTQRWLCCCFSAWWRVSI